MSAVPLSTLHPTPQEALSKDEHAHSWSVIDHIDAEVVLRRLAAISGAVTNPDPHTLTPDTAELISTLGALSPRRWGVG